MRQIKIILSCLFCALLCFSPAFAGDLRQEVAATFNSQVGVREATGRNDGPEVKQYLASVNLKEGYAWCGAFANWVLKQHGIPGPKGAAMANAWFPASKNVFYKRNEGKRVPQQADLFGIYYAKLRRIGHVGFIDRWDPGSGVAVTVEGNTNGAGSREGDGVYRKRRLIRQIYAVSSWLV